MILLKKGNSPLILCLPHSGTDIPPAVASRLSATGKLQVDISWRLEQVLDIATELDATIIGSTISRYVVDVDKDPHQRGVTNGDGASVLCPVSTMDGKRLYKPDEEPGPTEIEQRVMLFHDPFHAAIRQQIDRVRRVNGTVLLFDCQSRRSKIGTNSDETLPVVSLGTNQGTSCHPDLRTTFAGSFAGLTGITTGVDKHVHGDHLIRTYGIPESRLHALTVVVAQRSYLRHESPPFEPDKARIARLRSVLVEGFSRSLDWAGSRRPALPPKPGSGKTLPQPGAEPSSTHQDVESGASAVAIRPQAISTDTRRAATAVTVKQPSTVTPILPHAEVAE